MKDQLIKAINIFTELYPKYEINYIQLYDINGNKVTYRINGINGVSEVSHRITITIDL